MLEYLKNKKIMVVVAHPDDEILGVGASINILQNLGAVIKVVILGEGITSRGETRDLKIFNKQLNKHKINIKEAQACLKYQELSIYNLPDNRFDTIPLLDIIKIIEKEKEEFKPDVIFTHYMGDVNIDHQKTFEAVNVAIRPLETELVKAFICFETLSGTEWIPSSDPRRFTPNFYIEMEENNLKCKIDAMNCYEFEKRKFPHPRSEEGIKTRAKMWGISIGKKFAEAFQVIRLIS